MSDNKVEQVTAQPVAVSGEAIDWQVSPSDAAFHKRVEAKRRELDGIYDNGDCLFEFAYVTVEIEDLRQQLATATAELDAARLRESGLRSENGTLRNIVKTMHPPLRAAGIYALVVGSSDSDTREDADIHHLMMINSLKEYVEPVGLMDVWEGKALTATPPDTVGNAPAADATKRPSIGNTLKPQPAIDAGGRYRLRRWDVEQMTWVDGVSQPWDTKEFAIGQADAMAKRNSESYMVVDRLLNPVYYIDPDYFDDDHPPAPDASNENPSAKGGA